MQQVLERKPDIFHEQKNWNASLDPKDSECPNIKQEQQEVWIEDEEKPQSSQFLQSQRDEINSTAFRTLKIEVPGVECGGSEPTISCTHLQPDRDVMQQLLDSKEVVISHEQKKWNPSLEHEFTECPNIKQEQEELWSEEEEEEKPQASELHQSQRDASNWTEPRSMKIEGHGHDRDGSKTNRLLQPETGDIQQMMWTKEESFPEQRDWNPRVDQEDAKDEQKKLWMIQQGGDLQQLDEEDITVSFSGEAVLSENDDENQSDESRRSEAVASGSNLSCSGWYTAAIPLTDRQADGQDDGGPQSPVTSGPWSPSQPDMSGWSSDCSETDDSYEWKQAENQPSALSCSCSDFGKPCDHLKSPRSKAAKQYRCSECGRVFGRKSTLVTHMLIHTGEKEFSCWECGNRFGKKSNLVRHMRGHSGHKPYACSECDKRFGQKCDVVKHMRIHTGHKPFSCPECDKRFGRKCHLNTHIKIHTGEKPFSCPECGKRFGEKCTLNTHVRIHTGQKAFACSHCNKRFCQKGNLSRHMKIHTGEKPFSCSECHKRFRRKSHVISHMRVHQGAEPSSSPL